MNVTSSAKSSTVLEIERLGFKWYLEPQYDYGQLDVSRRVQVRDSDHYAPKDQVAQYASQMGETQFPPIVVSQNGWLVDGNTRYEAKKLRKEKFGPAIVIEADYLKETKGGANMKALAGTLNQFGGQRLTSREVHEVGKVLVAQGWLPAQIARALGIKASGVSQIRREIAASARFAKVGFLDEAKLSPAIRRVFGSADVLALNDTPFKKLADLATAANLSAREINELAREMKATGSDVGMISHIDGKAAGMADRIREHALLGNGRPSPSSVVRRALGMINKYGTTPSVLVERNPAAVAEHIVAVDTAITVLKMVAELQQEASNE